MASLAIHPAARRDYLAAIAWYQERSQTAAQRFVAEVDRVLAAIAEQPDRFGWYDEEFREAAVRRYPFSVVYRVLSSAEVQVVAIAHASREPGYWLDRT